MSDHLSVKVYYMKYDLNPLYANTACTLMDCRGTRLYKDGHTAISSAPHKADWTNEMNNGLMCQTMREMHGDQYPRITSINVLTTM